MEIKDLEQREDLRQLCKDQQDWIIDVIFELYEKVSQHRAGAQRLNSAYKIPATQQGKIAHSFAMLHEQVAKESCIATQATLKNETEEMVKVSDHFLSNLANTVKLIWRPGPFIWAVLIVLLIGFSFVFSKPNPIPKVATPELKGLEISRQASDVIVSPQVPPIQQSTKLIYIPEWEAVTGILEQIREAQLRKDIKLLLNVYSPTFPNIDQKKENILKTWHHDDYLDMHFQVNNIQKLDSHTIIGRVVWEFTFVNLHSKKKSRMLKSYTICFSDVSGKWLIQNIKLTS